MSAFFTRRMASPGKALPFSQRFAHVGAEGIQKILDLPLAPRFDLRRGAMPVMSDVLLSSTMKPSRSAERRTL